MSGGDRRDEGENAIRVRCPECQTEVRISEKDAERTMQARCPNGHVIPLAKVLS